VRGCKKCNGANFIWYIPWRASFSDIFDRAIFHWLIGCLCCLIDHTRASICLLIWLHWSLCSNLTELGHCGFPSLWPLIDFSQSTGVHPEGTCFSSLKFARTLNWRLTFLGLSLCIVVHPPTSISSAGIDKIKHWSIILIYNRFMIFGLPASNIQLLQGQVIHTTRWRWAGRPRHARFVRHISTVLRWKSKLCSLGIFGSTMLFVFKIKYFIVPSYRRTMYLCKHPVTFLLIDPRRLDS
jgi:hypothetical protein